MKLIAHSIPAHLLHSQVGADKEVVAAVKSKSSQQQQQQQLPYNLTLYSITDTGANILPRNLISIYRVLIFKSKAITVKPSNLARKGGLEPNIKQNMISKLYQI